MLKPTAAAVALLLAGISIAQARPSTLDMSCGEAAATVASYGAVVLSTGRHTYDRFVVHRGFCLPTQIAKPATAPTLDAEYCPVGYTCVENQRFREKY